MSTKTYEIVVWGASGFTGELVVRYLATLTDLNLKWAVAGRSKSKLEKVLAGVGISVPIVIADSNDPESLVHMVKQTTLVMSLVGPYTLYGSSLVKACAENGTHYVDLTGETAWIAQMIKEYGRAAISTQALIIHSCGFDSVPSDLCALLAVNRLKMVAGENVKVGEVTGSVVAVGGPSGGTIATALAIFEGPEEARRVSANPYCLSPIPGNHKPSIDIATSWTFKGKKYWGSFWFMGPVNSALVRRSWGILESSNASSKVLAYGPDFAYREILSRPGPASALITSFVMYFGFALLYFFAPARWAVKRWGPKSGEGPSLTAQQNGWFSLTTTAKSLDGTHEAQVKLRGKGDPGYLATSKMITECALAIVRDRNRLPPLAKQGGPLTPATALGNVLVERLEKTKAFSFTYSDLE